MVAARALSGSAQTFERIFAREYERVVSVAFRITRERAEAEDVAQEVFAGLARSRRTGDAARAWLYRATVHAALNAVRGRRRRSVRELRDFVLARPIDASAQRAADPQSILERQDEAQRVRDAMARIGRRDAELLAMRYGGLSYREMAQFAGTDAQQIGTRLARAERALKKEIERETPR